MLPDDLLRHITSYLRVQESLHMEVAIRCKLYDQKHYKKIWYREDCKKKYTFNHRDISIHSYRIGEAVYSMVSTRPKMQFNILHREEISTREANKKAYESMILNDSLYLCRRLEMIGIFI